MQEFKQRTFMFSVAVGKLILDLPYDVVNKAYAGQLIRSSSSVGANYRAAKRAKSDADFINKNSESLLSDLKHFLNSYLVKFLQPEFHKTS